jgi:DNA-binding PadR family transcriptional regulator
MASEHDDETPAMPESGGPRAEALKGHLDALIMAVLADEPLHGYAVVEALKQRSSGSFVLPEGTVYPALHRLERAGLLASRWSEGARRRRIYRLTARGKRALGVKRGEWRAFVQAVDAVLA